MRILIVADEEACGATCGGFSIDEAARLEDATGHIENVPYDAVVLDLGPDGDGLTLFRTIRGPRWPSSSDLDRARQPAKSRPGALHRRR